MGVGTAVAVAAGVSIGSAVCMGVGYTHGEVSVGTGVGVARLGRLVGFAVGFIVAVGFTVGVGVGLTVAVGSAVGAAVGFAVCVGCTVGVGSSVGSAVGCSGSAVSLISGVGAGSAAFAPPCNTDIKTAAQSDGSVPPCLFYFIYTLGGRASMRAIISFLLVPARAAASGISIVLSLPLP